MIGQGSPASIPAFPNDLLYPQLCGVNCAQEMHEYVVYNEKDHNLNKVLSPVSQRVLQRLWFAISMLLILFSVHSPHS